MATELFTAIRGGDKAAVEPLLERDRDLVDARDEKGLSPILAPLYRGRSDIAAAILRRGPKLSVFEVAAAGDVARVREIVGADPALASGVAPDGYSPLGLAAFFKRREVVRYLFEAGADPRPPRAWDASRPCTPRWRRTPGRATSRSYECCWTRVPIPMRRVNRAPRLCRRRHSRAIARASTCC